MKIEVPIVAMDVQDSTDNFDSHVQSGAETTPHVRRDVQKIELDTESVAPRQNFGDLDDSHDQRLRRVRQRVKRTDVAAVVEVFRALSERVGPVTANQEVPRVILRQTWSAENVPLMWAASSGDVECPVLLWLAQVGE